MKTIIQVLCIAFETNEIGDDPFTSYEIKCGLLFLHKKLVNFKMFKIKTLLCKSISYSLANLRRFDIKCEFGQIKSKS